MAAGGPAAAICVQDLDVQCVLQFTLINAAGCALHRCTNPVIRRQECFSVRRTTTRARGERVARSHDRYKFYAEKRVTMRPTRSEHRRFPRVRGSRRSNRINGTKIRRTGGRPSRPPGRTRTRRRAAETSSNDSLNLARTAAYDGHGPREPVPLAARSCSHRVRQAVPENGRPANAAQVPGCADTGIGDTLSPPAAVGSAVDRRRTLSRFDSVNRGRLNTVLGD